MATTSKSLICNLALAHIKQTDRLISNLDTDKGTIATQCRIHYDVARRFVLADFDWSFARKRVALTDIGDPPPEWLYRYDYPSDCIAAREIQRQSNRELPIPFAVEESPNGSGKCILTNKENAVLVYTKDVESESQFSPGFVAALGWYLGSDLAPAIAGDANTQQACLEVYSRMIRAAQAMDSTEGDSPEELDSPWDRARQGFGGEY